MKRVISIFFVVCLVLCACTKAPVEQTTVTPQAITNVTEQTTEAATAEPTQETTASVTTEATVPAEEFNYQNPLSGMPQMNLQTTRPYAVVINNIEYAQPMCSLNSADIVYEILAEGGITRCLAVYSDIAGLNHIGAIRSARPYLIDLANGLDAIFIHHGGSQEAYDEIYASGVDHLDALGSASEAYYRDQERLNSGYALEHTSFADGDDLLDEIAAHDFEMVRKGGIDYGYAFADAGSTEAGESATEMKAVFGSYGKTTGLTYNETTGKYEARQYGDDIVDGNTNEVVAYRNVLQMAAETHTYESGDYVRLDIELVGEGTGYFACDGKVVPICWSRSSESEPFVFTHEDGTPITFGMGNTYIAITPLNGVLEY